MDDKRPYAAWTAAALLLAVPVLYVGSYLALVRPAGFWQVSKVLTNPPRLENYAFGGRIAEAFYWPLEQVDRNVRPDAWEGWSSYPDLDIPPP
jgi:hypothetical protein